MVHTFANSLVQLHTLPESFSMFLYFLPITCAEAARACVTALHCKPHKRPECVCVCVKERIQLSTCQPFSFLSRQPLSACALYPMVQNREGLGKPLFPSPPLLHLPAFARHFWVANVKPTVFAPLYVTLSTFPPPHQIECPVQASYSVTIWHPSSISWSSCVWHLQF